MSESDEDRRKRLAEALRANLRKRKAQARGETASADPAVGNGDGDRHGDEHAD
jgi:hypothetical protein